MNMTNGALTLRTYPFDLVRIVCHKCNRAGQYHRGGLVDRFGPDMSMPELRHVLAQCSRRNNASDPCMVVFPDLATR
jgi:hypothetical protein